VERSLPGNHLRKVRQACRGQGPNHRISTSGKPCSQIAQACSREPQKAEGSTSFLQWQPGLRSCPSAGTCPFFDARWHWRCNRIEIESLAHPIRNRAHAYIRKNLSWAHARSSRLGIMCKAREYPSLSVKLTRCRLLSKSASCPGHPL
jgi:hypothetical protein